MEPNYRQHLFYNCTYKLQIYLILIFIFSFNAISKASTNFDFDEQIVLKLDSITRKSLDRLAFEINKINEPRLKYFYAVNWLVKKYKYSLSAKGRKLDFSIRKGIAVCEHYSRLTDSICSMIGIECDYIEGDVKRFDFEKNLVSFEYHAWNNITIQGIKFGSDVTWCDNGNNIITTYLLVDHELFNYSHYPYRNFSRDNFISKNKFKKGPILHNFFLVYSQSCDSGHIEYAVKITKRKIDLLLPSNTKYTITQIGIAIERENAELLIINVPFEKINDEIIVDYKIIDRIKNNDCVTLTFKTDQTGNTSHKPVLSFIKKSKKFNYN